MTEKWLASNKCALVRPTAERQKCQTHLQTFANPLTSLLGRPMQAEASVACELDLAQTAEKRGENNVGNIDETGLADASTDTDGVPLQHI